MKSQLNLTLLVVLIVATTTFVEAKEKEQLFVNYPLNEPLIELALSYGEVAQGKYFGLQLKDSAQSFLAATSGEGTWGFSLHVHTPFTWIAQNASWESKKYKVMTKEQVTEEMCDPVLRVYANPDMPTHVTRDGMWGSSGVEHVIIRSTKKKGFEVLQPLETQEDIEFAQNTFGAEVAYSSLAAYFNMDEVARISNLDKKGEFFIVVIGTTGEEKKFKVKTKHFKRLP